jgi:hypothetical protein
MRRCVDPAGSIAHLRFLFLTLKVWLGYYGPISGVNSPTKT